MFSVDVVYYSLSISLSLSMLLNVKLSPLYSCSLRMPIFLVPVLVSLL